MGKVVLSDFKWNLLFDLYSSVSATLQQCHGVRYFVCFCAIAHVLNN